VIISPEAKDAATAELIAFDHPSIYDTHERGHYVQLAINSATAPLQKEIERLRGEVEKAWEESREWHMTGFDRWNFDISWKDSRAKRVAEGKE